MDLYQISQKRSLLGKVGAALCGLLFLALLDGLIAQFRQPQNVFKVLPGESVEINGPLPWDVKGVEELAYRGDSEHLRLTFVTLHKGYFLGGDMWRGQIAVGRGILPGEFRLIVTPKSPTPEKPLPPFRIIVYADAQARRQSSTSMIQRFTGYSPWAVAPAFLPFILLAFGMVFSLSQKRETLMARQGKAEIYRAVRQEEGWTIRFGLGTVHGVVPGMRVTVLDEQDRMVAAAEVTEASETDSWATAPGEAEIKAGYVVSMSG